MGYFLEMGVAHYKLTGGKDRRLYEAAVRCADHLQNTFGPPPKRTWKNGHPGLEYALCRLARLVNEVEGAGAGTCIVNLNQEGKPALIVRPADFEKDAKAQLSVLGRDLAPFDDAQRARWYLLRATCTWHTDLTDGLCLDAAKKIFTYLPRGTYEYSYTIRTGLAGAGGSAHCANHGE